MVERKSVSRTSVTRIRDTKTNCYTQLKISRSIHRNAKAAAMIIGEGFYEFVEKSIQLRIDNLKASGELKL